MSYCHILLYCYNETKEIIYETLNLEGIVCNESHSVDWPVLPVVFSLRLAFFNDSQKNVVQAAI